MSGVVPGAIGVSGLYGSLFGQALEKLAGGGFQFPPHASVRAKDVTCVNVFGGVCVYALANFLSRRVRIGFRVVLSRRA